jgi:hypothetical protein
MYLSTHCTHWYPRHLLWCARQVFYFYLRNTDIYSGVPVPLNLLHCYNMNPSTTKGVVKDHKAKDYLPKQGVLYDK